MAWDGTYRDHEALGRKDITLAPPKGLIVYKYLDIRDNDEFAEFGAVGPYATAKTTAALDFLTRRALEYPGSNILMCRATLTSLKGSSLPKFAQRIGAVFESENKNEAVYRMPEDYDPLTGKRVQSVIKGIGLDRTDLEQVFRSTEYHTAFVEEGDEVDSDAHDILQARLRQVVFHRTKKVRDLAMMMGERWGVHPEEAFEIMRSDKRHPVAQHDLGWKDPMPGPTVLKTVWNPKGNDHLWSRYVGVPYPDPEPTPEWVDANVGVREVHVSPTDLRRESYYFTAGNIVKLPGGARAFAAYHDERETLPGEVEDGHGTVTMVDGRKFPARQLGLIVQRACVYIFREENESRNFQNDTNSYLMVNRDMRRRAFLGTVNSRMGRVFSNYVDDYVENGGHLLKWPGKERLARAGYRSFGGIDQGGRHGTALTTGIVTPETNLPILYGEYLRHGVSARESAYDAKDLELPGSEIWWGYDPAMAAKEYGRDNEYALIHEYEQTLANLMPGDRGKDAFDYVNSLLVARDTFIGKSKVPKLLVFDNLEYVRETMLKLTWQMVASSRDNWMVDMGDAIKIALSIFRKMGMGVYEGRGATIITAPPTYSNEFGRLPS